MSKNFSINQLEDCQFDRIDCVMIMDIEPCRPQWSLLKLQESVKVTLISGGYRSRTDDPLRARQML